MIGRVAQTIVDAVVIASFIWSVYICAALITGAA